MLFGDGLGEPGYDGWGQFPCGGCLDVPLPSSYTIVREPSYIGKHRQGNQVVDHLGVNAENGFQILSEPGFHSDLI
jgi:hypothetical protein